MFEAGEMKLVVAAQYCVTVIYIIADIETELRLGERGRARDCWM
jgi:hypothetical protein